MSLQARLDAIKKSFADKVPAEAKAVMERAARELADSGILEGVVSAGTDAPDFVLRDSRDEAHSLAGLHARGPLVLTFFRGTW